MGTSSQSARKFSGDGVESEQCQPSKLSWFRDQVVFLTGGTGGLGGCLVYKLALQLPTKRIFVLCRTSKDRAIARWKETMPTHFESILATGKIVFIVGDMTQQNYGISDDDLERLWKEATIILNCAANKSFTTNAYEAVTENCLPVLNLAKMASKFSRLVKFIHISTAYVNSFLPDGVVLERSYDPPTGHQCPEEELSRILSEGSTPATATFAWPCAQAKHLADELLINRHPGLPIMIIRPSFMGPAIQHPYPLYDPTSTNPFGVLTEMYLLGGGGDRVWHTLPGQPSATNIFDEVPIDLVANVILLHTMLQTKGIVHACAQLHVQCTGDEYIARAKRHVPHFLRKKRSCFKFSEDLSIPQCLFAELYRIGTRDWRFDCSRSKHLKQVQGALTLNLNEHGFGEYIEKRMKEIIDRIPLALEPVTSRL
ncbi:unnamed protein product [Penicillium salamii]|uniref:Fatty acyl-CoA reductase n=1 Tax=Penicillium salamii TaxID=1612424 RepID=A0A9W4JJP7_9EURO|nr:unnamed protein product [Penicillium salamii]CAG8129598.1 unnamed protein product [Penicillium salamii]CAG8362936.1 unnamed protein product [Penicillium salamii]CAG8364302.1 unnamed protein product [Penicillium salamii]CAG8390560.1 unnamed protein product [Penicillium salamii]